MSIIKTTYSSPIPPGATTENGIVTWKDKKGNRQTGQLTASGRVLRDYIAKRNIPVNERIFKYSKDSLLIALKKDLAAAGIEKKTIDGKSVDVHSFRKTFGTMLARAGVPLTTCQRLMRHSTPLLTAQLYIDVAPLDLSDAVEKLPDF